MPHAGGSGNTCRWVSALRLASASTWSIAHADQALSAGLPMPPHGSRARPRNSVPGVDDRIVAAGRVDILV